MPRIAATAAVLLLLTAGAAVAKVPLLWNLTVNTLNSVLISSAGKDQWGPEQIVNDKDGTVDPDERLKITGVSDGTYDVKFKDVKGRTCVVRNVEIHADKIFTIDEKELKDCAK
jgi:hypothetical protein